MHFYKMHGIGNDYIYMDNFVDPEPSDIGETARKMADVRKGIGSDGLILIQPSKIANCKMRMFNADGSEGAMCGNGVRCVGKFMLEKHPELCENDTITVETLAGIKVITLIRRENERVSLLKCDLGCPGLSAESVPVLSDTPQNVLLPLNGEEVSGVAVSMGSAHVVIFVDYDPMTLDLEKIGPGLENHPLFPNRVNVEFIRPLPDHTLQMRVWERGSGETFACGTGASASVVAAILKGVIKQHETTVHLRGGDLLIDWNEDGHVYMTGEAAFICEGNWYE